MVEVDFVAVQVLHHHVGAVGHYHRLGDEMLFMPESLQTFAKRSPTLEALFRVIEEMAVATREALGEERLAWLRDLPRVQIHPQLALVHASPGDPWRAPTPEASDAELDSIYRPLARPIAIYAHIHRSYVRSVSDMIIANTGSVSLPYDGDVRASYLLIDDAGPSIRRVDYDMDRELKLLSRCGLPHVEWIASILKLSRPTMPETMPSA